MTIVDLNIEQAKWFAIGAHTNQLRKYTGEPYWTHLKEVVDILKEHAYCTTQMLQAAWLHDVVEDTRFTIFDIREFFGELVADYVDKLTEPLYRPRSKRKQHYTERLCNACPEVQTIKYADLISNTSSIVERDPEFAKVYLQEKRDLLAVMNKGNAVLYKMACELAEKGI
jgi:(p)ppGpp synthase/HD superfamily hydrolase